MIENQEIKHIPIDQIKVDPNQPRKTASLLTPELQDLAKSIEIVGILQPILVERSKDDKGEPYTIVNGERRFQAAKLLNLPTIPCIIKTFDTKENRYASQIIENIHRKDFSPIERAMALIEYKKMLGDNAEWYEVERLVGISSRRRQQYMALFKLPQYIQDEIVAIGRKPSKNQITEKHARALLLLNNYPEMQKALFGKIKDSPVSISGDQAIIEAKKVKNKNSRKETAGSKRGVFQIEYTTTEELLAKLMEKIESLKENTGMAD